MADHLHRVSQKNLAGAIADAVTIEQQRIEQIDAAVVDQVSGGAHDDSGSDDPNIGTTMGYFPTDDGGMPR